MNDNLEVDVLIAGAGASGLTLAIELARRGVSFRVIDKLDQGFVGSRGKGIQPRTQELFEDLGILDRLVAVGGSYPPQREYATDGSYSDSPVVEQAEATPHEPYHMALMVPQFLTERVLRERLLELGHTVQFGWELRSFAQDQRAATAHLVGAGGEQTIRARYVIGADGGRSVVRHTLGIGFPGKTLHVRAVVADLTLSGLTRDVWHRFGDGDMAAQLALCPLAGTDLFQLQAPVPLEGDVDVSLAGLSRMIAERTRREDIRVHAVSWASVYQMNARLADHYRVGRVFLVGDAAHIHPPTGGQGLNTSVQDAYNLGWKLAAVLRQGAPETLLDSYEEERRLIAASILGLSTKLLDAMKRGELRRGRETQQLDLGYPESSLALEAPARTAGLLAGDRAPDALLLGAAGQPTRLFQQFQGTHWTLLAYEGAREGVAARAGLRVLTIGARGELRDAYGHVREIYGVAKGDLVLVRPDGYIAAIMSSEHRDALIRYFASVGLAAPAEKRGGL